MDPPSGIARLQWAMMRVRVSIQPRGSIHMQITILGIDISKNVFQLHGVDAQGKVRLTKRVARGKLLSMMT